MLTPRLRFPDGPDYAKLLCGFECCGEILACVYRDVLPLEDGTPPAVVWTLCVENGYKEQERTPRHFFPGRHAACSHSRAPRRPQHRVTPDGIQVWEGARFYARRADGSSVTESLTNAHRKFAHYRRDTFLCDPRIVLPDTLEARPVTIACWTHRHYSMVTFDQLESERANLGFAPTVTEINSHN